MWKIITTGIVVVVGFVLFFVAPIVKASYVVDEPYQTTEIYYEKEPFTKTETYTEREPFTRTEYYTESEPYNKSVPVEYIVVASSGSDYFWSTGFRCYVRIKNTDTQSGIFSVRFELILKGGAQTTQNASKYIAIGETQEIETIYKGAYLGSWSYYITPPTKTIVSVKDVQKTQQVTEYRDVQKTRLITEWRDVAKQREVTKIQSVVHYKKVSPYEYITKY
jgi:hypothetical protein